MGKGATSEAGKISSELVVCGGGVRSILLFSSCGQMPRDNRCMYMAHVCFYVYCSDCVGVCGMFVVYSDSDLIFRRTLLGYYAEGMHANFK